MTSRVQAPDSTTGAAALAFSAYVTPCAAAPASTVTAAEYFLDAVGADGTGEALPLGPNPLAGSISQAQILSLAAGRHTIYVHGRDSTGAWGEVSSDTFLVARIGPDVGSLALDPNPTNLDPSSTHLTGTADATAHAGRTVAGAEYFVDPAGPQVPGTGTALTLSGGAATSALDGDVPLTGLTPGVHTIMVEAQDDLGHWGATSCGHARDRHRGANRDERRGRAVAEQRQRRARRPPRCRLGHGHAHRRRAERERDQGGGGLHRSRRHAAAHNGWNLVALDGSFDQPVEQAAPRSR